MNEVDFIKHIIESARIDAERPLEYKLILHYNNYPYSGKANKEGIMKLIGESRTIKFSTEKFMDNSISLLNDWDGIKPYYILKDFVNEYGKEDTNIIKIRQPHLDERTFLVAMSCDLKCLACGKVVHDYYDERCDYDTHRSIFIFELENDKYRSECVCKECLDKSGINEKRKWYRLESSTEILMDVMKLAGGSE